MNEYEWYEGGSMIGDKKVDWGQEMFCKDCKWAKSGSWFTWKYAKCMNPKLAGLEKSDDYFVTGSRSEVKKSHPYCSNARYDGTEKCGRTAQLFEFKDENKRKFYEVEHALDKSMSNG